jgi:hypothetical protein
MHAKEEVMQRIVVSLVVAALAFPGVGSVR